MRALDRKLLRDLRHLWSQALTIALVVASGIGGFVTCLSAVDSLELARERFYASSRFADVFARLERAPDALAGTLRALPGVADAQVTVEHLVRVGIEGVDDPIVGQLIGLDLRAPPRLNRLVLASGRQPQAGSGAGGGEIEALVSAGFARARGLGPGSRLSATINGRRRTLQVTGVALSPEFVFAGLAGMPDLRGFGVFWVDHEVLAAAFDMRGAFNRVALRLAPGAAERAVVARLDEQLAGFGGAEAHGRDEQPSHAMLDNEIQEQRVLGTVLPSIFLGVAAFLLNVVVSRLVATQREQIAALKALGYADSRIAAHYLKLVMAIVAAGLVLGAVLGERLGTMFLGLYADFFFFPVFEHRLDARLLLVAGAITLATAALGTLNAIAATVRLAPAEAMRPPAPGRYRRTVVERLGLASMSPAARMVLRNMERRPLRTALSIGGISAAVAVVVMGNFFRDAIDFVVDAQFNVALRGDVQVWLARPADEAVGLELARLPGVRAVEAGRDVPVRLSGGHRAERVVLQGLQAQGQLHRVVSTSVRVSRVPADGLLLTDRLAARLGVRAGDTLQVEVLEGRRQVLRLPVRATVPEMMGLNAYIDRTALNRLLGEGPRATRFAMQVERGSEPQVLQATRDLPRVVGAFSKATLLRNMEEVSARNVRIMSTVLTLFAVVIAVGVVYNIARIALSERTWELASLRVLGFTRGEVSALLLGEMALGILLALPLGMLLGHGLVHAVVGLMRSDAFDFPVVIMPRTYAWAAITVVAAGAASALVVRRHVDRLDMVAALKTRE